ncbi:hypothetical protein IWQ51_006541 [Labrenzia sp. EL_142]|nr:hypothetical protein [Labrenzia sp. EL_142]
MRSTYLAMLVFFLFGYSELHVHAEVNTPEAEPIEAQQIEAKEVGRARQAFSSFGLGLEEKQEVYRALRELGYANEDLEMPDFLLRKGTIQAVAEFQRTIGAAATGFLTSDQVEVLRSAAGRSSQSAYMAGNNAKSAFENLNLGCEDHRNLEADSGQIWFDRQRLREFRIVRKGEDNSTAGRSRTASATETLL